MSAGHELGHVITSFRGRFMEKYKPPPRQVNVLDALEGCRTAAMGGHAYACPCCGAVKVCYNSCGDRHCPKCQGFEREKWVAARKEDLLPVKYFHVVFTLPHELHPFCLRDQRLAYGLLFRAAWATVKHFAAPHGVQPGMVAVLHTWTAALAYHPHLHCIVPAGGITEEMGWKPFPNASNPSPYLFNVKGMGTVFRAKYMDMLQKAGAGVPPEARKKLFQKGWVVYSKHPFCRVETTVDYLGRYSHRAAITNRRIKEVTGEEVAFEYKDRKDGGKNKQMRLKGEDFLARFCLHVLPKGLMRMRHYGFLAASNKDKLNLLKQGFGLQPSPRRREKVKWADACEQITGKPHLLCPHCQDAQMLLCQILPPTGRGPPPTGHSSPDFNSCTA